MVSGAEEEVEVSIDSKVMSRLQVVALESDDSGEEAATTAVAHTVDGVVVVEDDDDESDNNHDDVRSFADMASPVVAAPEKVTEL